MEKITFNKHIRPKSAKIGKYALTDSNIYHNKYNNNFPSIRDRLEQKYFYKNRLKNRNNPEYSHQRFFCHQLLLITFVIKKIKTNFLCVIMEAQ